MLTCKKCSMSEDSPIHLPAEQCGKYCTSPQDHHTFEPVEDAYRRLLDIDGYGATLLTKEAQIYLASIPA